MSTSMIQSASVATEATFANPDANGIPTTSGLTFYGLTFDRGSFTAVGGETPVDDSQQATNSFAPMPPEAGVAWVNGGRVVQQKGTFTLNCEVRGYGGGNGVVADANTMPLTMLWGTITSVLDTGGTTQAVISGDADKKSVKVATGTTLAPGEVVLASIDGCVLANRVIKVSVDTVDEVTFELAWPRQLTSADVLQRGMQFRIRCGASTGSVSNSVAVRFRTLNASMVAYGCRAESLTFTPTANGKLMVAMVMRSDYIVPDVSSTALAVDYAARFTSPACQLRGSGGLVSTEVVNNVAAPVSLESREPAFEIEGWAFAIGATLTPIGSGCGAIGISNLEVSAMTCTLAYTSRTIYSADEYDRRDGNVRALSWAAGPISDGTTTLNGWGASLPAAFLTADSNVEVGGEVLSQTRAYSWSFYDGDDPSSDIGPVLFLGGT